MAYIGNGFDRVLSWQKLNSGIPTGRFGHTCTLVGNCLVLFGGINDSGLRLNDTWIGEIDLRRPLEINISWRLLDVGSVVPPPRGAHAACSIGDCTLAIHGGIALDGRRLSDTWLLDLSEGFTSGNWHQLLNPCPSPPPRSGHTLTSIDETLMVLFGGRGSGYEVLNDLWLFDASKGYPEWKEIEYEIIIGSFSYITPTNMRNYANTRKVGRRLFVQNNICRHNSFGAMDEKKHTTFRETHPQIPTLQGYLLNSTYWQGSMCKKTKNHILIANYSMLKGILKILFSFSL